MSKIITEFEELKDYIDIGIFCLIDLRVVPVLINEYNEDGTYTWQGSFPNRVIQSSKKTLTLDKFKKFIFVYLEKQEDAPEIFQEACEIMIKKIKQSFKDAGF